MAQPQHPSNLPTPSRRRTRPATPESTVPEAAAPDSRAARNRERRERSMERQFSWLFIVAVGATTLYLLSRTPLGLSLMHSGLAHWHL